MVPLEQTPERPPKASEQEPALRFEGTIEALRKSVGPERKDLPHGAGDAAYERALEELSGDHYYADFSELHAYNELLNRRNALQRQADSDAPDRRKPVNVPEFVVVNQAVAFHEYFPEIMHHLVRLSDRYVALRASIPDLPPDLLKRERESQVFLTELRNAIQQRVDFSNASLLNHQIATQRDRRGEVAKDQKALVEKFDALKAGLDPAGQLALTADREAIRRHINALDQRIIVILGERGHLPGTLLLDVLAIRYKQLLDEQKLVAKDNLLTEQKREFEKLKAQNDAASKGQKNVKPLSESEGKRYEELRRLLQEKNVAFDRLSEKRRETAEELISVTQDLGNFQIRAGEITTLQSQFRGDYELLGAPQSNPDQTPKDVREAIDDTMKQRSAFHIGRMDTYLERFDKEVLDIGLPEIVEDFSNTTGREFVRQISNRLASLYTFLIPETAGLRDHARQHLAGPLNEAMGWPADKMDVPFEDLPPEDQQRIFERAKSVKVAIEKFDKGKIVRLRETLAVVRDMPAASTFVGEPALEPLPGDRVTPQNRDALVKRHGGPTVYVMLVRQLQGDWGTADPKSGFCGEYATFLRAVDTNMTVHLDVGSALFQQGDRWGDLMWYILYGAAGAAALYAAGRLALARRRAHRRRAIETELKKLRSEREALGQKVVSLEQQLAAREKDSQALATTKEELAKAQATLAAQETDLRSLRAEREALEREEQSVAGEGEVPSPGKVEFDPSGAGKVKPPSADLEAPDISAVAKEAAQFGIDVRGKTDAQIRQEIQKKKGKGGGKKG